MPAGARTRTAQDCSGVPGIIDYMADGPAGETPRRLPSYTHDKTGFNDLLEMELDNFKAILAAEVSCLTRSGDNNDDDEYDDDVP